jgi:hypothetical protein
MNSNILHPRFPADRSAGRSILTAGMPDAATRTRPGRVGKTSNLPPLAFFLFVLAFSLQPSAFAQTGAAFTLTGSKLAYHLALDAGVLPLSAGIMDHESPRARRDGLIAALNISLGVLIPEGGIPGEPGVGGQVLYRGEVRLTDEQAWQLKRGELDLSISNSRDPRGELSGHILPMDNDQDGLPDYINNVIGQ